MVSDWTADSMQAEDRTQRDLYLRYGSAFQAIPRLDTPSFEASGYIPRPSPDTVLTALCQLTAIRLGAQRAMISIIDDQRQHILAEATCNQSLRPHRTENDSNTLWLGNVSIPRKWGLCEQVLDREIVDAIFVINDLSKVRNDPNRVDIQSPPTMQFFASKALLDPTGIAVGSVCIYDDKPRDDVSSSDRDLLKDFASTIIEHLDTYSIRKRHRTGERFVRGLTSFSEGASGLAPFLEEEQTHMDAIELRSDLSTTELDTTTDPDTEISTAVSSGEALALAPRYVVPKSSISEQDVAGTRKQDTTMSKKDRAKSARHKSIRSLQDRILPADARSMFSRAANILLTSCNIDGVLMLDASVAANVRRRSSSGPGSGNETHSDSKYSKSSSSDEAELGIDSIQRGVSTSSSKLCQVLGVATRSKDTEMGALLEPQLSLLLQNFPCGQTFTFTADGICVLSMDSSGTSNSDTDTSKDQADQQQRIKPKISSKQVSTISSMIQKVFPTAHSVAFVPFWDFERSRWYAGCLCWSNSIYKILSTSADIPYIKVFGHSIMRELSRLDALSLSQTKTTFMASISHEIRSPLHGILTTLEFFKDTTLNSFQISMLNTLSSCSRTLLDTINHLMDHANMNKKSSSITSKRLKNANTIRLSSRPIFKLKRDAAFDLCQATEDVVEAVFSGSTHLLISSSPDVISDISSAEAANPCADRKQCLVVLDLAFEENWNYCFPIGSWKRIVMNLLGNAIKYTTTGFVGVTLRAEVSDQANALTTIILSIKDTGSGISPAFLADSAFLAFSQENSHSVGTGLGLSVVRSVVESRGGRIELSSDKSGTRATLKLFLPRPDSSDTLSWIPHDQYLTRVSRLEGRRIYILYKKMDKNSGKSSLSPIKEGLVRFVDALVKTLETHLKMEVVQTEQWEGHDAELVILPELSFQYLREIRRRRTNNNRAPVTVFVAMDNLEASALRADARVNNPQSVVEIMTQPCGPHKLAYILTTCLDRFAQPEEIVQRLVSRTASPHGLLTKSESPRRDAPMLNRSQTSLSKPTNPAASLISTSSINMFGMSDLQASHDEMAVLIADDNAINRRLLSTFLKKQNLEFTEAVDGLEALNAYKQSLPKFHMTLMDISMPVMDGMSATRAIRQYELDNHLPRSCIVALTGLTSPSAKLEAWSSGIDHFITKPVDFKKLKDILMQEVRRGNSEDSQPGRQIEFHAEEAVDNHTKQRQAREGSQTKEEVSRREVIKEEGAKEEGAKEEGAKEEGAKEEGAKEERAKESQAR